MRILFVGQSNSVHSARWLAQLAGEDWEISLLPVQTVTPHADLMSVTIHPLLWYGRLGSGRAPTSTFGRTYDRAVRASESLVGRFLDWRVPTWRARRLARLVRRLRPDILHSMEMQQAGYMTLEARPFMGEPAPAWVMGIWGSDVYLFGRISSHRDRVRAVLADCDYYLCECRRDVDLAVSMGLGGRVLPPLPAHGGLDLRLIDDVGQRLPPSRRRVVMVKGYQSFAGRALTALRAVALAVDSVDGHQVRVYSASPDVRIAAEVLAADSGLDVDVLPRCSHRELLAHMAEARVVIGLSISDGLPSSLVEAMGLGAFPIQSSTSCASEWIAPGTTGFLVSPEDPFEAAEALKTALSDDMLVDSAADLNRRVVCEYLAADVITPQAIAMYRSIVGRSSGTTGLSPA